MTKKSKLNQQQIKALAEKAVEHSKDLASKLPLFGHITWLYTQSAQHKHYFLQDLESRVLPAIVTEQCKIYLKTKGGGLPLAFVSWAYMSEQAEERYINSQRIAPGDWKSGDRVWLIDLLTPFGGAREVILDLSTKIHKDKAVNLLFPDDSGSVSRITLSELSGRHETAESPDKTIDTDSQTRH